MIRGAAVVPTAPLLVPGMTAALPPGVDAVADAVDAAVESLPDYDVAVLVAAAAPGAQGVYLVDGVDFAGLSRPEIARRVVGHPGVTEAISRATQYPVHRGESPPLDLATMALLFGGSAPLVLVAVPSTAAFDALAAVGTGVAAAVEDAGVAAVAVAAGDLSAGLTERSPRHLVAGAADWDAQVVAMVDSGRFDGLERLGPQRAARVGARGWAALAALHGICERATLGVAVRHYSAPRGVGYLVAAGR